MRYQVPQFIEVEDKIFGPLTLKQFIYLVGGAGLCFLLWRILPFFIAIILIIPVVALSLGLAFYKINNRPFIVYLEAMLQYAKSNRLYLWDPKRQVENAKRQQKEAEPAPKEQVAAPKLSESKLKDLAWSLDIKESVGGQGGSTQ